MFNQTILTQIHEENFDIRNLNINPANDTWAAWKTLADEINANQAQFQSELPAWYCRGMCFATYIQCIWDNPNYPARAICDAHWEQCVGNCNLQ